MCRVGQPLPEPKPDPGPEPEPEPEPQGIYTVVETNLQQFVEIAGGVIPLMAMGAAGFQPLGGCHCGCGIPCGGDYSVGLPYARRPT